MECRIRKHDDYQFEVKVAYPLERRQPEARCRLEMFIFLPYPLGVDAGTYSHEQFYDDLRSYTRFKTPDMSLRELLNPDLDASPLTRIVRGVTRGNDLGEWDVNRITYELKMLGNVIRTQARDGTSYIRSLAAKRGPQDSWEDVSLATTRMLNDLAAVLEKMRTLRNELLGPAVPEAVVQAFDLANEYVSLQVEFLLLKLLRFLARKTPDSQAMAEVTARLRQAVKNESEHRAARGYLTLVSEDETRNEYFLYRESLLKKFCANVLFLSVDQRIGATAAQHFLYALAAGIAMTLGVMGLWLAMHFWGTDVVVLGLAGIILYMFRDRVKDLARVYGGRLLPRWVSDRTGKLVDRRPDRPVGSMRETMRWLDRGALPRDVHDARQYEDSLERSVSEPTERIIHYSKDVRINSQAIFSSHERAVAIDEILRMQIANWLERMDNPRKTLLHLRREGTRVSEKRARRVYHVNLVVRLTAFGKNETLLRKARLVLTKNGIERIDL